MKPTTLALALVMATLTLGSTPLLAAAKGSDEAQIKALEQRIADGANAKDVGAIMKNFASDETLLVFDVIPPREYRGADAFRKDWEGFFDRFGPITIQNSDMNVTSHREMAFATYIAHLTGKGKDGNPMDVTMRITDVLRKSRGKWLIVHEHVSVPVDLASGKADLSSKP
jgi:ketosteroid isomerase-like protein